MTSVHLVLGQTKVIYTWTMDNVSGRNTIIMQYTRNLVNILPRTSSTTDVNKLKFLESFYFDCQEQINVTLHER